MKADGAGHPFERIDILAKAVPSAVKRCVVTFARLEQTLFLIEDGLHKLACSDEGSRLVQRCIIVGIPL
jgi:hypothetical protein